MSTSYVTQSRLGEWFGLSPVAVGKLLTARGLKDRQGATEGALLGGFAKEAQKNGIVFYIWNAHTVSLILDEALGGVEKPFIDNLAAQVGEAISEAERHRANGDDVLADLIMEQATQGVPPALVKLIQGKLLHQHNQT